MKPVDFLQVAGIFSAIFGPASWVSNSQWDLLQVAGIFSAIFGPAIWGANYNEASGPLSGSRDPLQHLDLLAGVPTTMKPVDPLQVEGTL